MSFEAISDAVLAMRQALRDIPRAVAHQAAKPPALDDIYASDTHDKALDPDRALVVGNRGVGKSYWASVLADERARRDAARTYPRLGLDTVEVVLGFHESAGKVEGPAPSPERLGQLLAQGFSPEHIWRGVLLQSLGPRTGLVLPATLGPILTWLSAHLDEAEAGLRRADSELRLRGARFVLVFDALDRLGSDWPTIRRLTTGLLRFALDLRGYRALRSKLFMRTDQARDDRLFQFPDASKLRAEKVDLVWRRVDLYGLLYTYLWHHAAAGSAFRHLVSRVIDAGEGDSFPRQLKTDELLQANVISAVASPYMGSNPRAGKTYTWLTDHISDAFGEVSPRSFLVELQTAAESVKDGVRNVLDHNAIKKGVERASEVRLDQLEEDYVWVRNALKDVVALEVPCSPTKFIQRWVDAGTAEKIHGTLPPGGPGLGPVELVDNPQKPEEALLLALTNIGVVETRANGKINIPELFRVAAGLKRRGGQAPPKKKR